MLQIRTKMLENGAPVLEEITNLNVFPSGSAVLADIVAKLAFIPFTNDADTGVLWLVMQALDPVVVNNTPLTRLTVPFPLPRSGNEVLSVNSGKPTAS